MENLSGLNVLVTGASGFIGSHLVSALLSAGVKTSAVCRTELKLQNANSISIDVRDSERLARIVQHINPDIIFHLAGTIDKALPEKEIMNTNYVPATTIINAMGKKCRFVFASATELYIGNSPPFKEDTEINPATPYAKSKAAVESYCKSLAGEKDFVCLRPTIAYGPGQIGSMFIPSIMRAFAKNEDFRMTGGEQTRDFVYVSDVVEAFLLAATKATARGKIINIGCGSEILLKDVAVKIKALFKTRSEIKFGAVPYRDNELWRYFSDISLAREILGWQPKVGLDEGLQETAKWWLKRDA